MNGYMKWLKLPKQINNVELIEKKKSDLTHYFKIVEIFFLAT